MKINQLIFLRVMIAVAITVGVAYALPQDMRPGVLFLASLFTWVLVVAVVSDSDKEKRS